MPTTVVKVIGTGGDYSTPQAGEDAKPVDFTAVDELWQFQLKNQLFSGTGVQLTIAGSTSDATRYCEFTTQSGASWRDNASVQTNAYRYNSSNGAAISGSSGYTSTITISEANARLTNIQVEGSAASGGAINATGANVILRNLITEHRSTSDGFVFGAANVQAYNCLIIGRKSSMTAVVKCGAVSGSVLTNCTIVVPTGLTAPTGLLNGNYGTATLKNCVLMGGPIKSGSTTYTFTTCYTDQASPPTGFTQTTYNTSTFAAVANGSHDYRLVSGSALVDTGTTDSTNVPTDGAGTARPSGSAYDVGSWELVQAGGPTTFTYTPSGGITFAGSAALAKIKAFLPSGGISFAGVAAVSKTKAATVSGGLTLGGSATLAKIKVPAVSGGATFGGTAVVSKLKVYAPTGGAAFSGVAPVAKVKVFTPTGSVVFAGAAATSLTGPGAATYTYVGTGGLTFGGAAALVKVKVPVASGLVHGKRQPRRCQPGSRSR
jgi:hypothetical protein